MENLNLKKEVENNIDISVISAVYNEEDNLNKFIEKLTTSLENFTNNYEIIFVLDPSKDKSEEIITEELKKSYPLRLGFQCDCWR